VVGATTLYLAFACYLTWPVILHLGHLYYGGGGDALGGMANYRELVDHHHNPFLPGTISQLAAPEGQTIPWARNLAAMPSVLTQFLLTAGFGQIAAYNLYAFLGYVLSGVAMFLFVRRLTANAWVALLCGWVFAFYPFAVVNGGGHDDFIHGWVLVLAVWRMVELQSVPTRRNAIAAGLAVSFGMWWTPYFILIGGVAYFAAAIASLAVAIPARRFRLVLTAQAITAGIVLAFLGSLASLTRGHAADSLSLPANGLAEFNTYSARPLEYFLPDVHSLLFGSDTAGYLTTHLHGSNFSESTLYVGVTVIALAIAAMFTLARGKLTESARRPVVMLAVVAVAAFLASAPPEASIFGVTVPFPSHFIMKVTSAWRAYSRFVIVVMLALSALAGIGLDNLIRARPVRWRVAVLLMAFVVVPIDLGSRISQTNSYGVPTVFRVLARQPRGLTAEYPLTPAGDNLYGDVFYQNVYDMPLINGYLPGSLQERRAVLLSSLSNPSTAGGLATLGVRYVVREAAPPAYGLPLPGLPGAGFRRIFSDSWAALYVVTAHPAGAALPAPGAGFANTEFAPNGTAFNWLEQSRGTIELAGNCRSCRGVFRMTVASFARPRTVTLRAGARVLLVRRVSGATMLQLPLRFASPLEITVTTSPGPQSIAKTTHSSDTRSVSVQVSGLSFNRPSQRGNG
jgi:hypothetical protein